MNIQEPLPEKYRTASETDLADWIRDAKTSLGESLFILGHHYQRDEVIQWADARGDSFRLARIAAENDQASRIVFCGVHFMAESADVLTGDHQQVVLPDLNAGCSMADMANIDEVAQCWSELTTLTDIEQVVPITYMNSSAALKAFVGEHGGAVCTSSNARAVIEWALERGRQILFFPDQHLGRNTAYAMGYTQKDERVWNPRALNGGLSKTDAQKATFLLWKGHCSVHQRFHPEHVQEFRVKNPKGIVIVHPECPHEVVELADQVGSTERIITMVEELAPGTAVAIGTEINLVKRLATQHPELQVECLEPMVCPCVTMSRIDTPHLAWVLENIRNGNLVNQIAVTPEVKYWAKIALDRMLEIV